jgi:hypothetical protein
VLVEKSCDSITYEEAFHQFGANRNFIRSQLLEIKKKQVMDDDLQLLIDEALLGRAGCKSVGPARHVAGGAAVLYWFG